MFSVKARRGTYVQCQGSQGVSVASSGGQAQASAKALCLDSASGPVLAEGNHISGNIKKMT